MKNNGRVGLARIVFANGEHIRGHRTGQDRSYVIDLMAALQQSDSGGKSLKPTAKKSKSKGRRRKVGCCGYRAGTCLI